MITQKPSKKLTVFDLTDLYSQNNVVQARTKEDHLLSVCLLNLAPMEPIPHGLHKMVEDLLKMTDINCEISVWLIPVENMPIVGVGLEHAQIGRPHVTFQRRPAAVPMCLRCSEDHESTRALDIQIPDQADAMDFYRAIKQALDAWKRFRKK